MLDFLNVRAVREKVEDSVASWMRGRGGIVRAGRLQGRVRGRTVPEFRQAVHLGFLLKFLGCASRGVSGEIAPQGEFGELQPAKRCADLQVYSLRRVSAVGCAKAPRGTMTKGSSKHPTLRRRQSSLS